MTNTKYQARGKRVRRPLTAIHAGAAGLDVGATFHVVAVPPDRADEPVRTFQSFTGDLQRLADWLTEVGVTTIAMESIGVYWIPVFEILEARGFEVLLVNARDAKNVPGRKTDVNDAQWLQQLHEHGLLRGSFRPSDRVVPLRALLRHREGLVDQAAAYIQRMQKALMQMNVQLHHVVADITGVTGMKIVRAIVDGTHDPDVLAQHRDVRCKESVDTIRKALAGNYRPEHLFALRHALELYDFLQTKLAECDGEIECILRDLNADRSSPGAPLPAVRQARGRNEPGFDVRRSLYTLLGADLSQIHGLGPYSVLRLVAECGDDMRKWPTAKHFTSWLTLAPGNKISGGRVLSSKTRRSSSRAAALLRIAAVNIGRTQTAIGAFYRRLAARLGKAKAVTATARKLAVLGKLFGLPYLFGPVFVGYNKSLFLKRGIKLPNDYEKEGKWTWDTLLEVAKQLTAGSGDDRTFGITPPFPTGIDVSNSWMWPMGGQFFDKELKQSLLTASDSIVAHQYVTDLFVKHRVAPVPSDPPPPGGLAGGRIGMALILRQTAAAFDKGDFEKGMVAAPKGKGGRVIRAAPHSGGVLKATKHLDQAYELVKFFSSTEAQRTWTGTFPGSVPVRRSLAESQDFVKGLRPWESVAVYRESNRLLRVSQLPQKSPDMDTLLTDAQKAMQLGQQTVEVALNAIKPQWDTLFQAR